MKRIIRASYDDTERITTTLTRTIEVFMHDVEIEVDENSIDFSNYDWASYNGDGEHEVDWPSEEDDPEIEDLDYTSSIAEKVEKLLLDRVFERVNTYRTFKINRCSVTLIYLVSDVSYEVNERGVYTRQGEVSYNNADIFWSEADSEGVGNWSRL